MNNKLIWTAIIIMAIAMTIVLILFPLSDDIETTSPTTSTTVQTTLPSEVTTEGVSQTWANQDEWDLLAAVIYYEAGSDDCTDRHQQLVAQVVLNRVASGEFPNTVYDVITQNYPAVQYSYYNRILDIANNTDKIPERCYDNALSALLGEVECPSNIVWQANFKQGSGIYEIHKTSYSTTYFCYR